MRPGTMYQIEEMVARPLVTCVAVFYEEEFTKLVLWEHDLKKLSTSRWCNDTMIRLTRVV